MANPPRPAPPPTSARQLSMALDSARLRGMSAVQRAAAVARLADLLTEAGGGAAGGCPTPRRGPPAPAGGGRADARRGAASARRAEAQGGGLRPAIDAG